MWERAQMSVCSALINWCWLQFRPELCAARGHRWCDANDSVRALCRRDFDLYHAPSIGLFSQLMRWKTQVQWWAQSGWRRGVKGCWLCGGGLAPPSQEVGGGVVVGNVIVCLLVLTGLLFVDFRRRTLLENGPQQDGGVVGVFCLSLSFRSIEYVKCILPALALQRTWEWLVYLLPRSTWSFVFLHPSR